LSGAWGRDSCMNQAQQCTVHTLQEVMGNSLGGGGDGVVEEHPRAGGVLWIVPRGRPSRVQPTLATAWQAISLISDAPSRAASHPRGSASARCFFRHGSCTPQKDLSLRSLSAVRDAGALFPSEEQCGENTTLARAVLSSSLKRPRLVGCPWTPAMRPDEWHQALLGGLLP
jgi:hypothetical protein